MNAAHPLPRHDVLALRWLARGASIPLLLFWGPMFVGLMIDWFGSPAKRPASELLTGGLPGMFLLGLLVGWKRELLGAGIILVAATFWFTRVWFGFSFLFLLAAATGLVAGAWMYCVVAEALARRRADAPLGQAGAR